MPKPEDGEILTRRGRNGTSGHRAVSEGRNSGVVRRARLRYLTSAPWLTRSFPLGPSEVLLPSSTASWLQKLRIPSQWRPTSKTAKLAEPRCVPVLNNELAQGPDAWRRFRDAADSRHSL